MDFTALQSVEAWYREYVAQCIKTTSGQDRNLIIKDEHTRRVCNEINDLSDQLHLNESQRQLAWIMALLHDIGRFEQFIRYGTFVDAKSHNHAELGIHVIEEHDVLQPLIEKHAELIKRAVLYHNRLELPKDESAECLFFTKLLRDADKLDIWRVCIDYYQSDDKNDGIVLDLPETPVLTAAVCDHLLNGRMVPVKELKSVNDFKLLQMGWVYDLNFLPTLQVVQEREYIRSIVQTLPDNGLVRDVLKRIDDFILNKLKGDQPIGQLNV